MPKSISFKIYEGDLVLQYSSDLLNPAVYAKLGIDWDEGEEKLIKYTLQNLPEGLKNVRPSSQDGLSIMLKRIFYFSQNDLVEELCEFESLAFKVATTEQQGKNNYYVFRKEILGIEQDVLWCTDRLPQWKYFGVGYEHRTSVFKKIFDLTQPDVARIIIGGALDDAIPWEDFDQLLHEFPTTIYLRRYGENLISQIISNYLPAREDYAQKYVETQRRITNNVSSQDLIGTPKINESMHMALVESRNILSDALEDNNNHDNETFWQKVVLSILPAIYPQYIAVLREAIVDEKISKPTLTHRKIDHLLIDAEGNVDILEVKCPFPKNKLLMSRYRDNYRPASELSGGISQIEKYIYYLNHLGSDGEAKFSEKWKFELSKKGVQLPSNMKLRILNPHGLLLIGKIEEADFTFDEQRDFDLIRRQYSHVADIITYNDLLARLNRIIDISIQPHGKDLPKA